MGNLANGSAGACSALETGGGAGQRVEGRAQAGSAIDFATDPRHGTGECICLSPEVGSD
jgi:hypothetical protein